MCHPKTMEIDEKILLLQSLYKFLTHILKTRLVLQNLEQTSFTRYTKVMSLLLLLPLVFLPLRNQEKESIVTVNQ